MPFVQVDINKIRLDQGAQGGPVVLQGEPDYLTQLVPDQPAQSGRGFVPVDINQIQLDKPVADTQQPDVSIGRTALDQGVQGATFGFGDEISDALGAFGAKAYSKAFDPELTAGKSLGDLYNEARGLSKGRLNAEIEQRPALSIASNVAGGLLTGVGAATTKAGTAFGNSLRSGNVAARIPKGFAAGAASGGLYGAGAADEGHKLEGAGQGAIIGGAFGAAAPAVGAAVSGVKNAVLPAVKDSLKPLAKKALDYGIPLTRSQLGDSRFAKTVASVTKDIPLSGALGFARKQGAAFNRAVAKTFGEEADAITPEVIDQAYTNIGKKFDEALAGRTIKVSDDILNQVGAIEHSASQDLTGDTFKIVKGKVDAFLRDIAEDGTISGEKINSLRSSLSDSLKRIRNDSAPFLHDLQDVVVDASVDGAPGARELLNTARLQYKNLKTIEPLAAKAVDGYIAPSLLLDRVRSSFKNFSRGGGGELGDLARIGQAFLKDTIPNSGTPMRIGAYAALGAGGPFAPVAAAKLLGTSAAFNAANTSQRLVKRSVNQSGKKLPKTVGINPALLEGNAANLLQRK